MIKKLLIFSLVLVGMVTLSACKTDDGPTDLEKLGEAMADLDIALEVSDDIVFVDSGLHDVVITWVSDNTDVIANDGTVTRPLFTEGNVTVTVTASLTIGEDTLTKIFSVTVLKIAVISEAEQVAIAQGKLLLSFDTLVVSDMILPVEVVEDEFTATVTWSSSDTSIIANDGTITRPAIGEGNIIVTLTATLTVGTETLTKTFEVTVKEDDPSNLLTILQMKTSATEDDIVELEGIVISILDGDYYQGYYLYDGTGIIYVFTGTSIPTEIVVGAVLYIKGTFDIYYDAPQVIDVSKTEVGTGTYGYPTPVETTIAAIAAVSSDIPTEDYYNYYSVTGTITFIGDAYYLVDGTDKLEFGVYTDITDIIALVGKTVTMPIVFHTFRTDISTHRVIFIDDTADIVEETLTEAEALAVDVAVAISSMPGMASTDITFPATGLNGTTFSGWTSSDTDVFADDGTFVARGVTLVTITFTGTAVNGSESTSIVFEVVVPLLYTVEEALLLADDALLEVTGVVYDLMYYGAFIHADGEYIFVYGKTLIDELTIGDEITVLGYIDIYTGLQQVRFDNYTVGLTAQTTPTAEVMSLGALAHGLVPKGTVATVTVTLELRADGDNTDTFLIDSAGTEFEIYYRSNVSELTTFDGLVITLDVIYYNNYNILFSGVAGDVVSGVTITDAMMAADIAAWIDLGDIDNVAADLTLPDTHDTLTSTITWASSDVAVGVDGVIVAVAGSDTVVTLTATVTVGLIVVTRDIVVTVLDANGATPISVADAILAADYESILVQGIITAEYGSSTFVIQDADGVAAITTYDYGFFADEGLAIGDEIIVRADRETYNGLNELTDLVLIEVVSTGNAFPEITGVTVALLVADMNGGTYVYQGQNFELTGLIVVSLDDGHGAITVKDDLGNEIKFSGYLVPYATALWAVDDVVDLSVTGWDVNYSVVRVQVYAYPTITDAQTVEAAGFNLDVATTVTETMELPLLDEIFGAAITWETSDAAFITTAGVVVRPAIGEANATVTLTATLTVGTETVDKVFVVTVVAIPEPWVAVGTEIFISEYIEGSSNNKALELFNPTADPITLTGYVLNAYNNGSLTVSNTLDLSSYTIGAGQTLVIYNSGAVAGITDVGDISSAVTYFNGDDAITLEKNGVIIDIIGVVGTDPGSNWPVLTGSTGEHTLVRAESVTGPNTTFTENEWVVYDQDTIIYLGEHTVVPAP